MYLIIEKYFIVIQSEKIGTLCKKSNQNLVIHLAKRYFV